MVFTESAVLLAEPAVLNTFSMKDLSYGLRVTLYFFWSGISHGSHFHWLTFSLIVLAEGEAEGNRVTEK